MLRPRERRYLTCKANTKDNMVEHTSYKKSSFGPAFFFLDKRRREALATYYEFCRLMDDIADEPDVKDPLQQLDFWQTEIQRVFAANAQTDLGKQLTKIVREFNISEDRFLLLIEGMRADLQAKTYATLDALDWYLYRVAVVVGLATLDILEVRGAQAQTLADNLGRAVQLTNIIRDVSADARLGRVYLPEDLLVKNELTRQAVLTGKPTAAWVAVLEPLAQKAQNYYRLAEDTMTQLPRMKMLPCRMMACVYAKNLAKIKKSGFWVDRSIKLTKTEKLVGVLHACCKTFLA